MNLNLTFFGQIITFCLFVALTMKLVWPKLSTALETRRKTIAEGLHAASQGKHALEKAEQERAQIVAEAQVTSAQIISRAKEQALRIEQNALSKSREDAERIKHQAHAELAQEVLRARDELRGKVADLVIKCTEKLLAKNIDASSEKAMLADIANQI